MDWEQLMAMIGGSQPDPQKQQMQHELGIATIDNFLMKQSNEELRMICEMLTASEYMRSQLTGWAGKIVWDREHNTPPEE